MKKYIPYISSLIVAAPLFAVAVNSGLGHSVSLLDSDSLSVNVDNRKQSVVDEVVWIVGDEPILKSDIEVARLEGDPTGKDWDGKGDCRIPEQLAVNKLFLHQAVLDIVEVSESEVTQGVEQRINYFIQRLGSREALEQSQNKSLTQIRQDMREEYKNLLLVQRMQEKIVENINVSPAEVRDFFRNVPEDSLPLVPTMVEVQILTNAPKIEQEEINRVKDELRSYTERVNNGETSFSTLARFYSQDPGSARQGGELGYMGRGMLDPAFAAVAFNLTDPSKISKIVESDFGYHIIQLIDRRGDKINCRHILLKPRVSDVSIENAKCRLDSIANDIREGKFTFDLATSYLSDDKDTKSNNGLMVNSSESSRTSRFRMQDLPSEVAQIVDTMKVGEISKAFQMVNDRGKTVCAIVKLKSRIEAHKATITEDFQVMKDVVMAKERQETLQKWVENKIKNTYVRMNPDYDGCDFEYQGWIK